jgi:hypothetical protein
MSDFEDFGRQLRQLVEGFLGHERGRGNEGTGGNGKRDWGRRIDVSALEDLYGPRHVKKYEVAPAGIDNLSLSSTDTFFIPGKGTFTANFEGFFRVARENPKSQRWSEADVYVNMAEMGLRGESELGPIHVSLNEEFVSAGQTFGPRQSETAAAKCRIAAAAEFALPEAGLTLFNKEPILLMNDAIESIPPVEDPKGEAHIYFLPLFDKSNPASAPVAYLTRLQYTVGNYISKDEIDSLRSKTRTGSSKK